MITTETQYRSTQAWAAQFEAEADEHEAAAPAPRTRLQQARIDAARSVAVDLRQELADYRAGQARAEAGGGDQR